MYTANGSVLLCALFIFQCLFGVDSDSSSCIASKMEQPNILFILLDDLGWGDLSLTTGQFPTPNMNALMSNALTLERHYVHLMCSPSRTQFLTGRYAMNMGFGVFLPWDSQELGGIPIGQPTIANWLSEFGDYTTYGVGKWHLGYANEQLTPLAKGFHHFYGFYQGALDYYGKTYNDIEAGDVGAYDFWNDGVEDYEVIADTETITMKLYEQRIIEYLQIEQDKAAKAKAAGSSATPWYMFAALQTMHVPFPENIPEYDDQCLEMTKDNSGIKDYVLLRKRYCTLLLLTDDVIGNIMSYLKDNDLYDNTLIVFTTDNGGETARGASNYPFRGTKGELWEGNTRVLTALTGGVIDSKGLSGQSRDQLFSNLDWTPTLLEFTGYLYCIGNNDYTWDGQSQFGMITDGDKYNDAEDRRDHLVLNVGDLETTSASILVEIDDVIYKYIKSDPTSATDRWIYSGYLADVWSAFDDDDAKSLKVREYQDSDEGLKYSQVYGNGFLFDLTNDEAELYNLLNPKSPHYDDALTHSVVKQCQILLDGFMRENDLFSNPIDFLHARLPLGDPGLIGDGMWVRPFLDDSAYNELLIKMFMFEEKHGRYHSDAQKSMYYDKWSVPQPFVKPNKEGMDKKKGVAVVAADGRMEGAAMEEFEEDMVFSVFGSKHNHNQILTILIVVGSVCIALLICMIVICHCNKERKQRKKYENYLYHKENGAGYRTF